MGFMERMFGMSPAEKAAHAKAQEGRTSDVKPGDEWTAKPAEATSAHSALEATPEGTSDVKPGDEFPTRETM